MSAELRAREYIAWAEADVPKGRTFEDWHDKGTMLLRQVLDERDAAIRRAERHGTLTCDCVSWEEHEQRYLGPHPRYGDELMFGPEPMTPERAAYLRGYAEGAALRSQESQKPPETECICGSTDDHHHAAECGYGLRASEPPETEDR